VLSAKICYLRSVFLTSGSLVDPSFLLLHRHWFHCTSMTTPACQPTGDVGVSLANDDRASSPNCLPAPEEGRRSGKAEQASAPDQMGAATTLKAAWARAVGAVSWQFVDHDKHASPTNYSPSDARRCISTTTPAVFIPLIDTEPRSISIFEREVTFLLNRGLPPWCIVDNPFGDGNLGGPF
jgi:hypothetical protein